MSYTVKMTGPQLRVLHELLSAILNDPDWGETIGQRDWGTLVRVSDTVMAALHAARRAESTPV